VPLEQGILGRQRLPGKSGAPNGGDGPQRFRFAKDEFSSNHWTPGRHALKNLDPGVGARFDRMNHKYLKQAYHA